jgi:hypothetical protein
LGRGISQIWLQVQEEARIKKKSGYILSTCFGILFFSQNPLYESHFVWIFWVAQWQRFAPKKVMIPKAYGKTFVQGN